MNCIFFKPDSEAVTRGNEDLFGRWREEEDSFIWINLIGPLDDATKELLTDKLDLHPLALQDAARDRHPPKLEIFDHFTFLIFREMEEESIDIGFSAIQLVMFVGDRFLVTRSSSPSKSVKQLDKELHESPQQFAEGPGALAARNIRLLIDRYLAVLLELEPKLEAREENFNDQNQNGDQMLAELTGYKTDLKRLRRIFLYHVQLLNNLRKKPGPGFPKILEHELNDVYEQQERANSLTQLYYELASDLIEGFLSLSAHRLNEIMKVLTIITAIFVPLSFLAGIYGMNFENMPELGSRWGYFLLLGIMAFLASTLMFLFRRRKWI